MKKADKMLLAVITLSAVVLLIFGLISTLGGTGADHVIVYENERKLAEYSLADDGVYEIETEHGRNTLNIQNGTASITDSDCPGGDCMRMKISRKGGSIICLPHHLVIRGEGNGREGIDAIAR
ncbi:MAG: NusG domain II-containing protein [Lachnospiraceae bacterium]|nr:NusG domain II-containing protein [Lachnospiraceae bacterium]